MKKIVVLLTLLLSLTGLQGYFRSFSENPADLGDRQNGDIVLPLFEFKGGMANNNLSLGDLQMFEKDHLLTQSEKDKLTGSDLNFCGYGSFNLLSFGLSNWEISSQLHVKGYLGNLDREFMQLVFEGNESADYTQVTDALNDTYFYQFIKTGFSWAYPQGLSLASLPVFVIADKNSGAFVMTLEDIINYVREMEIYLGARLNWYNSFGYAEVLESRQEFISSQDSLYAYNYSEVIYNNTENLAYSGNNGLGFGLGARFRLPAGWFHISIDDLGAKLTFSDLVMSSYYNYHLDYLDFINEDHEALDESEEVDEVPYGEDVKMKLNPTLSLGAEYELGRGFSVMAKYFKCDYVIDGFFVGTTYRPVQWLPLQLIYGAGDTDSFQFRYGFETESFDVLLGLTNYNGLFNGTKGYGGEFGIKFKF